MSANTSRREQSQMAVQEGREVRRVAPLRLIPLRKPRSRVYRGGEKLSLLNWMEYKPAYQWFSGTGTIVYEDVKIVGFTKCLMRGDSICERKLLAWCAFRKPEVIAKSCLDVLGNKGLDDLFNNPLSDSHRLWNDEMAVDVTDLEEYGDEPGVWQVIQPMAGQIENNEGNALVTWHPVPVIATSLCSVGRMHLHELMQKHPNTAHYVREKYFRKPVVSNRPDVLPGKFVFSYYRSLIDYIINYHDVNDYLGFNPTFGHLPPPTKEFCKVLAAKDAQMMMDMLHARELVYVDLLKEACCNYDVFTNKTRREIKSILATIPAQELDLIRSSEIFRCMERNEVPHPDPAIDVDHVRGG